MAAKYGLDLAAVYARTGRIWTPIDYVDPVLFTRGAALGDDWLLGAMAAWTLPFLWIALSMTLRRALDAGQSPWLTLGVLVPGFNYAVMLALCVLSSRPQSLAPRPPAEERNAEQFRSALLGVAAGVAIAIAMVLISTEVWHSYGAALFFFTPVVMGAVSAYLHNRRQLRSHSSTLSIAALTTLVAGGVILVFALEGAVCLVIVFPLAFAATLVGAEIGRAIAERGSGTPAQALLVVLELPLLAGVGAIPSASPVYEVASAIEIDATPERVWENVIGFSELPPPSELVFASGVAYPVRARIDGHGLDAVRHCEFSTGAFVEPITRWDAPSVLAFDVVSQPPPMQEWSPYGAIVTPHLYGYFRSVRGEFRLVSLAGGRTRLEGSTWYELDLFPRAYFHLWSDALVSRIHRRVLAHVKRVSESALSRE